MTETVTNQLLPLLTERQYETDYRLYDATTVINFNRLCNTIAVANYHLALTRSCDRLYNYVVTIRDYT